jgi:hypothetical protein
LNSLCVLRASAVKKTAEAQRNAEITSRYVLVVSSLAALAQLQRFDLQRKELIVQDRLIDKHESLLLLASVFVLMSEFYLLVL